MTYQALILAAGFGRRMQPYAKGHHKALLRVGERPLIDWAMEALVCTGAERVTVVSGYQAEELQAHMAERWPDVDVRFVYNENYALSNNIASLALGLDAISADLDVVVLECDLVVTKRLLQPLVEAPGDAVALLDRYRLGMDGTVVSVRDGVITAIHTPDTQGESFSFADKYKTVNVYKFDRRFVREVLAPLVHTCASIYAASYYELVLSMLCNVGRLAIKAVIAEDGTWAEVDDPNDLHRARFCFEQSRRLESASWSFGGYWGTGLLDFAFMQNAYFPPPGLLASMKYGLGELLHSYGSRQEILNAKVSYFLRCSPNRLVALAGASEVFPILARLFRKKRCLIPEPTFGEYKRAFPKALSYPDRPGLDLEAIRSASRETDLVVIVNPNNPTGSLVPTSWVWDLASSSPRTLFLVDESLLCFSDEPSLIPRLESDPLPNLAVLASLGKALGVPGLRLGYLYTANERLVQAIEEELPIWHVSSLAEFFLEQCLKFRDAYEQSLRQTIIDRKSLAEGLLTLDAVSAVYGGGGNFILVELQGERCFAHRVAAWLAAEENILVKDVSDRFLDRKPRLRVALRDSASNERFLSAIGGALGALQSEMASSWV